MGDQAHHERRLEEWWDHACRAALDGDAARSKAIATDARTWLAGPAREHLHVERRRHWQRRFARVGDERLTRRFRDTEAPAPATPVPFIQHDANPELSVVRVEHQGDTTVVHWSYRGDIPLVPDPNELHTWGEVSLRDDLGTTYEPTASEWGNDEVPGRYTGRNAFSPSVPLRATTLWVRHKGAQVELRRDP